MSAFVKVVTFIIVAQTDIITTFVVEPDDACPAPSPCYCRGTKIFCGQSQLNTFPVFTRARKSWTLFINYNNISVFPDGALKDIKVKELVMDMMNLGKPVTFEDNAFQGQEATLEKISMVDCGLTELPPAFRKLNALTDLSLDSNDISTWDDAAMRILGKDITRFSAAFFSGDSYKWPPQFKYFEQLDYLDLSESVRFVPDLDNLSTFNATLTKLILARMGMTEVPGVLKYLPRLSELDLGHNQINESGVKSDSFTSQMQLQYLTLSYNQLKSLPDGLSNLKSATYLDVSGNPMTAMDTQKLPTGIIQLIADHCKLKSIPTNLQRLNKLEKLVIYSNSITAVHRNDLNNMPNLKIIFSGRNLLTSPLPPNTFAGDVSLVQISIEFNRRSNVSFSFSQILGLPKLLYLSLENPICTCENNLSVWWKGLTKQPDLSGHCINTSKRMKDFLTTCQP